MLLLSTHKYFVSTLNPHDTQVSNYSSYLQSPILLKSSLLDEEMSSVRLTPPISCDFADHAVAGESLIFHAGRCPGFPGGGGQSGTGFVLTIRLCYIRSVSLRGPGAAGECVSAHTPSQACRSIPRGSQHWTKQSNTGGLGPPPPSLTLIPNLILIPPPPAYFTFSVPAASFPRPAPARACRCPAGRSDVVSQHRTRPTDHWRLANEAFI